MAQAHLPPLWSRVRLSVTPCGFHGGRNGVWVGFFRGLARFPLPEISFHHFSTLISFISFRFLSPCDGATVMIGPHPCYTLKNLRFTAQLLFFMFLALLFSSSLISTSLSVIFLPNVGLNNIKDFQSKFPWFRLL